MTMESHDSLFALISELVMRHSPSGVEQEVDELLRERFAAMQLEVRSDPSGNLIAKIPGTGHGSIAITAHKDEIGAIVTAVEDEGRVKVRRLGGSFPWVYGEGVFDLLGDVTRVSGVLSFGSRHVSHASPQHAHQETAPLKWADVWIETKRTREELAAAGVRPGTPAVVGKHRKAPLRLKEHIASYTLDNKASVAVLLELARRIERPQPDVYLVASAKEEVGAFGAMYFTRHQELDALIALEIAPIAPEYSIKDGIAPVLLAEDTFGLYDYALNEQIRRASARCEVPLQLAVLSGFGSDASVTLRAGHVPKAACLGFATQNTHGYEIAHLGAIENCIRVLEALCRDSFA
jgi:putative aminopeptidase FrvX